MENQVDEIKSKNDIIAIIGERIQLKKAGRNYKALCPFHSEKSPSFMVSPELQMYKCFGCFPADQLIKTPFGPHKIKDIVEGEYVISGKGKIRKVLTTHVRDYKGDLITLKLSQLNEQVSLTKDHMVFVIDGAPLYSKHYKYLSKRLNTYRSYPKQKRLDKIWKYFPIKKIKAEFLSKGMTLLYPLDTTTIDIKSLDLTKYITKKWPPHGTKPLIPPLQINVDNKFLRLLGYYIAEGSNHRAYIRFSLGSHEEGFAKEIVELIKEIFSLEAKIYKRKTGKTGIEITACNSILANIFENLCGKWSENKHIPFIFQQLPKEKQSALLEAIFKGDGNFVKIRNGVKTQRRAITTTSRILSGQLTDILLKLGSFPSVSIIKEKYSKYKVHHKEAIVVSWSTKPSVSKFHHFYETKDREIFWLLPILHLEKGPFWGKVYNLTIEDDHSYIANTFAVANCGEAGDAIAFLEKFEGMEFREALKYLADRVGIKLASFRPGEEGEKEKLYRINSFASRFYNYILLNHRLGKPALTYLTKDRGLTKEAIDAFQLGFSPDVADALSSFLINKKKFQNFDLEKAGISLNRDGKEIDRFRGRIIFPLFDHRGNVVGFAGRVLPWQKGDFAKYVNTPETPIYHKGNLLFGLNLVKEDIKKEGSAIVVEGELDMISSWQAGVKNTVAIKGSALTQDQVKLLGRFTGKIILALDSDFAGDIAARRGIAIAQKEGMEIKVARMGKYKDPDEAARANPEDYKKSLESSVGVWDYLVDSVFEKEDAKTGEGKFKISREIVPVLASIPDKIVQAHYINLVAQKLSIPVEAVSQEVEKISHEEEGVKVVEIEAPLEKGRRQLLEERLLTLAFTSDPKMLLKDSTKSLITTPLANRILEEYERFSAKEEKFSASRFAENLPKELFKGFAELVLADTEDLLIEKGGVEKETATVIHELNVLAMRHSLEALEAKIRKYEKEGEEKMLKKSQEEFGEMSQKLSNLEEAGKQGIILNA